MKRCMLMSPGRLTVEECEQPKAGPGDIVIRVEAALTCGTDLKAYRRGHPKMPCPTPFGHEFAGRVVETGAGVEGISTGEAVMAADSGPCNECFFCLRGQENLCETIMDELVLGGYGEYLRIPARVVRANVFPKPERLAYEHAALLEPLSSVCHGLSCLDDGVESVLLLGAGPIALLWTVALKARGVERVGVVARRPDKLRAAEALGADAVGTAENGGAEGLASEIGGERGPDAVVECTGAPEVWAQAHELARRGGLAVLFGGCPVGTEVAFDAHRLHYDGVRIVSPFHFRPRDVRAAHDLLTSATVDWAELITSRASLAELPALFERLAAGGPESAAEIKTAVLPHAEGPS